MGCTGWHQTELEVLQGHATALVVLSGTLRVNGSEDIKEAEVGLFDRERSLVRIDSQDKATVLMPSATQTNEPIVGRGPFVMSNLIDLREAMIDYENEEMGRLGPRIEWQEEGEAYGNSIHIPSPR